jgi:hypothetical protein
MPRTFSRERTKMIETMLEISYKEALKILALPLPPSMYKPVGGGMDLTDIKPIARIILLTNIFGPVGIGWRLDYDAEDVEVVAPSLTRQEDKAKGRFGGYCVIKKVNLFLRWKIDGELVWSEPIPCPGVNRNPDYQYTGKGAMTAGFGGAISMALFQASVYGGVLNHKNASGIYKKVGPHPFERELLTGYSQAEELSVDKVEKEEPKKETPPPKEDKKHWSDLKDRIGGAVQWALKKGEDAGNLPDLRAVLKALGGSVPEEAEEDVLKVLIQGECAKIEQAEFLAKIQAYAKTDAPF